MAWEKNMEDFGVWQVYQVNLCISKKFLHRFYILSEHISPSSRGVHLDPDPIQPTRPNWNWPTHDRPVSSGNQWRVTNPKSQVRWVGWQVLSSKARLNRPNRRLQKSGNSFWSNYFRSNEIYSRFREIIAKSGGNLTRSSEISPDVVRSPSDLANFPLKKPFWQIFPLWTTQPKPTAFWCLSDRRESWSNSLAGQRRVWTSSTRFCWIGRRLGTNPT